MDIFLKEIIHLYSFTKCKTNEILSNTNDRDIFLKLCEDVMNKPNIYEQNLFKTRFKDIYNEHKYTFPLNDNTLSNIITKWKNTTFKYNKTTILFNRYDCENRLILRDYRTIYIETEKRKNPINVEYTIWGNDENIGRMRKSKHYFIDVTFHHLLILVNH